MSTADDREIVCPECGRVSDSKYCPECGLQLILKHRERIQDKLYAGRDRRRQAERQSVVASQTPGVILGISTAVVFVGAFMPWFKVRAIFVGELSKSGTEGDGLITLILAVVAAVILLRWFNGARSRGIATALTIIGIVVAGVAVLDLIDVSNKASELSAETDGLAQASAGEGLWATLVGGIGLVLGGVAAYAAAPISTVGEPTDEGQAERHFQRGLELGNEGEWKRAIAELDKAASLNPNHVEAHLHRGFAHAKLGRDEWAVLELEWAKANTSEDDIVAHIDAALGKLRDKRAASDQTKLVDDAP